MNVQKRLSVTYDNYGCNFCYYSFYSNSCFFKKAQIKKKDNRQSLPKSAVIGQSRGVSGNF